MRVEPHLAAISEQTGIKYKSVLQIIRFKMGSVLCNYKYQTLIAKEVIGGMNVLLIK